VGKVESVSVEDHTVKPDIYGKKGFYTLIFRWLIIGQTDEDGNPVTIPQYVKFLTGDKPYKNGARAGKLPWLTEITRAFGLPDIQPGDAFDPESLVGKRAKLGVLLDEQTDGTLKNSVNTVSKPDPRKPVAAPKVAPKPVPAPAADEDEDDLESVPF
jgi:hypothetical protein